MGVQYVGLSVHHGLLVPPLQTDISHVVIEQMAQQHASCPKLKYRVSTLQFRT